MLANVTQAEIAAKGPRKVTNMVEPFCTLINVEANPLRSIHCRSVYILVGLAGKSSKTAIAGIGSFTLTGSPSVHIITSPVSSSELTLDFMQSG
jgi:hypothetical protein